MKEYDKQINPENIKKTIIMRVLKHPLGWFPIVSSALLLGLSVPISIPLIKLLVQFLSVLGISAGVSGYSLLLRPKRLQKEFLDFFNEEEKKKRVKEEEYFKNLRREFERAGHKKIAKEVLELQEAYRAFQDYIQNVNPSVTYRIEMEGKEIFENAMQVFESLFLMIKSVQQDDPQQIRKEISYYKETINKLKGTKSRSQEKELMIAEKALALRESRLLCCQDLDRKIEKALFFTENTETWLKNAVAGNLDFGINEKSKELTKAIDEFRLTLEAGRDTEEDEDFNKGKDLDLL